MRLVVFGAGAIGSILGAYLARSGHDILLIGKKPQVDAIERDGLRIDGLTNLTVHPRVAENLRSGERSAMVILTVKSYDTEDACYKISRALTPRPILSVQNGLCNLTAMEKGLTKGGWANPRLYIALSVLSWGATLLDYGRIRHAGTGPFLVGDFAGGRAAKRFASLFEGVGISTVFTQDILSAIWRKAIINAAINPVTALYKVPNGEVLAEPLRSQSLALLHEALEVARAEGYRFAEHEMEEEFFRVLERTSANQSSMLQDVTRGKRTELDAISGEILARGAAHGMKLPRTERVVKKAEE
ncbi:MAG: 2-dehydropantoate 2-reductase, partial [Candidatus Thermoplasmatota archaeon]|nr:2-dehydropantoate 2-reductase [Candidatus Thermoplasmatota archaeon]